jgi:hypothetical protein
MTAQAEPSPYLTSVHMGAAQGAAMALLRLGRTEAARARLMEATAIADRTGDRYTKAFHMMSLGFLEIRARRLDEALVCFGASIRLAQETGGRNALALALDGVARVLVAHDRYHEAVQLATVAARVREELGGGLTASMVGEELPLDLAAASLSPDDLARAQTAGHALHLEDAVTMALAIADTATASE